MARAGLRKGSAARGWLGTKARMLTVGVVVVDRFRRGRHDLVAERRGGGEDPVVGGEMDARSGDQRGEPFDQGEGIDYDMCGAIGMQLELRLM